MAGCPFGNPRLTYQNSRYGKAVRRWSLGELAGAQGYTRLCTGVALRQFLPLFDFQAALSHQVTVNPIYVGLGTAVKMFAQHFASTRHVDMGRLSGPSRFVVQVVQCEGHMIIRPSKVRNGEYRKVVSLLSG